jgi:nitrogenase-associated protein
MALVYFYEKPGCLNNTRQKQLLVGAGHLIIVHDLLSEPWSNDVARLRSFFHNRPVAEWFNPSAPRIKQGLVNPQMMSESQAIEAMIDDPILIRRPLIESDGIRWAGFDVEQVDAWIGLSSGTVERDLETCTRDRRQTGEHS